MLEKNEILVVIFVILITFYLVISLGAGGRKKSSQSNMIMKEKVRYVEELAKQIKHAKPYYVDSDAKLNGGNSKVNDFPNESGVYLIMRRVDLPQNDYTTVGVNTQSLSPIYIK